MLSDRTVLLYTVILSKLTLCNKKLCNKLLYLAVNGKRMYFFAGVLASLGIHDIDGELVGFPSWRDTYATRISEEGVPDRVMRGILGHTKQRMTDLYNHDTESARRQKANIEKALEIKPDE